jgi:hypothetical protein
MITTSSSSANDNDNDNVVANMNNKMTDDDDEEEEAVTVVHNGGGGGMAAMLAAAVAKREQRINKNRTSSAADDKETKINNAISDDVNSSADPAITATTISGIDGMAAMIAEAVAKRQNRIETKTEIVTTISDDKIKTKNVGGPSLADMAAEAASKRKIRMETQQQNKANNPSSSVNQADVVVAVEEHRKTFMTVAEEAAEYGRLVRLREKIVEAEAPMKKPGDDINGKSIIDTWTGPKLADDRRSNAMRAIIEAAAAGRMRNSSHSAETTTTSTENANNESDHNTNYYDTFDIDNQVDEEGRKVLRTNYLLDKHVQEERIEKKERMWTSPEVMFERDDKTANYKSFGDVELPTDVLPTFRLTKKNDADVDVDDGNSNINNDNSTNMNQLRILESISNSVAASAWERNFRLQRPKAELRITRSCQCPYCKDPSAYQTHKYKRLMYPDRFRNDTDEIILQQHNDPDNKDTANAKKNADDSDGDNGAGTAAPNPNENRVVKKKKMIRIVRRKKKKSNSTATGSTADTIEQPANIRVIDGTALSRDQLQQLQQQLQQQGTNEMTTEELLHLATNLSSDTRTATTAISDQSQLNDSMLPLPSKEEHQPTVDNMTTEQLLQLANDLNKGNVEVDLTTEQLLKVANNLTEEQVTEMKLNDHSALPLRRSHMTTSSLSVSEHIPRENNHNSGQQKPTRHRPQQPSRIPPSRTKSLPQQQQGPASRTQNKNKILDARSNHAPPPSHQLSPRQSSTSNQQQATSSITDSQQPSRRPPSRTNSLPIQGQQRHQRGSNPAVALTSKARGRPTTALETRSEHSPRSRQRLISPKGRPSTKDEEQEKLPDKSLKQPPRKPPNRTHSLPMGDKKKSKSRSWLWKK